MHRLEGRLVAVYDHLRGAVALYAVAVDDAYKALVGIGVHEYLDVHHLSQRLVTEHQDTLHYHHFCWLDVYRLFLARAGYEVVGRHLYGLSLPKHTQVFHKQRPLYRGRLVVVHLEPFFKRNVGIVAVIAVLRNHGHPLFGKRLAQFADHCRFSGAGASGYSYYQHKCRQR